MGGRLGKQQDNHTNATPRNVPDGAGLVFGRVVLVPLAQAGLALPRDEEEEVDHLLAAAEMRWASVCVCGFSLAMGGWVGWVEGRDPMRGGEGGGRGPRGATGQGT